MRLQGGNLAAGAARTLASLVPHAAVTAAVMAAMAGVASAAGGGDTGHSAGRDLMWNAINFVLLIVVLVAAVRKPALAFFADRRDQVRDDVDKAAELFRRAEENHADWNLKLANLEEELDQIRRSSRNRAEQEREHILAEARSAAERIQGDAVAAVEQELRRAQTELRKEASELALELATQLIQDNIGDSDRDRLMDEFISGVERPGAGR